MLLSPTTIRMMTQTLMESLWISPWPLCQLSPEDLETLRTNRCSATSNRPSQDTYHVNVTVTANNEDVVVRRQ